MKKSKKIILAIIIILVLIAIGIGTYFIIQNSQPKEEVASKTDNSELKKVDKEKYKNIEISANTIANNPLDFYGKSVINYETPNNAPVGYQVFHSDGVNIYLIADDYIPSSYAPNSRNGYKVSAGMSLDLVNILNDYDSLDTLENNPATKWIKKYLDSGYECTVDKTKEMRYLLDTEVWKTFKSDKAQYAIAGPTVELYVESYNTVHPDRKIDLKLDKTGYLFKWNDEAEEEYKNNIRGLDKREFNNLYVIHNPDNRASAIIIAYEGKDTNDKRTTFAVDFTGVVGWSLYNCMVGSRPIICLNSDVTLAVNVDGYLVIK